MNKFFKTMMLAAATVLGIASCENVPAPFIEPGLPNSGDGGEISLPYHSANLKSGFEVHTVTGSEWSLGNTYAKATGYNSGSTTASETYLITPAISLGDAKNVYVNFDYVIAYTNSLGLSEGHKVLVCSDYNSVDPSKSDWITLPFEPKEREDRNSWDMYPANTLSIPESFLGKTIRIAFLYKCNDTSASTWELTNLNVSTEPGSEDTPDTPSEPKGDGTLDNPYNLAAIWALYENGNPEGTSVHVKGIISQVKSLDVSKWQRAQYFISDDGTENGQFQIYNGYYLNGQPFTANDQIKVGDEVIVYGELSSYNGTPQIGQNSKIVSINGETEGGETPDEGEEEDPDTPSSAADWSQSMKDLYSEVVEGNVDAGTKSKDGVTITFEKNGGNNMPKYYFNANEDFRAVRMYALNSMEIKSDKQISKIVLKCTSPSGETTYNGNRTSTVSSGNIAWANDNQTVTISDINSNTFSLVNEHEKNSGGVQYRIHSMEIFYSK